MKSFYFLTQFFHNVLLWYSTCDLKCQFLFYNFKTYVSFFCKQNKVNQNYRTGLVMPLALSPGPLGSGNPFYMGSYCLFSH